MHKISINFHTLGCRLNQTETAALQALFAQEENFRIVDEHALSQVAIINSCTVTAKADQDARKLTHRLCRRNPAVKIAVIGCQAQTQKNIVSAWTNVQWVVGNKAKMDLVGIIKSSLDQTKPFIVTPAIGKDNFIVPTTGLYPQHTRANIKIQDGCDAFCSFCEVPYARGRARSREFNDILREARELVRRGFKEIVMTGINIGTYQDHHLTILDVIGALEQIEGLQRIRISSIEPTTLDPRLFLHMFPHGKLCRFLHIPLQSADDTVLKAMNRKHSFESYAAFITRAKKTVPEICIGSDILVGFPGETDDHFERTRERLQNAAIDYFHVFRYSPRLFAKSKDLKQTTTAQAITYRSEILRQLSLRKRKAYHQSLVGTTQYVLFEEEKNGFWSGLTDHYIRVRVESSRNLRNQLIPVELLRTGRDCLFGHL